MPKVNIVDGHTRGNIPLKISKLNQIKSATKRPAHDNPVPRKKGMNVIWPDA